MKKRDESKSVFINTKLATVLTKEQPESLFDGNFRVNNAPKTSTNKNTAKMMCSVQLEQNDIRLSREIDAYDRAIQDAVCTLMESGRRYFTSEQLARAFAGRCSSERGISKARMDRLNETMEKLANIRVSIVYANKKGKKVEVNSYLMPMNSYRKVSSGTYIYKMLDWPAIYTFAASHKQLISVPIKVMDADISVKDTDDVVLIKRYLIRRIEMMKNQKNHIANNCISYESIFQELGLCERVSNIAKKKVVIRSAVNDLLRYFVQVGYIKEWSEYRQNKSKQINGVKIVLEDRQEAKEDV